MRLDRWFRIHFPDVGYSYLQKLLRTGQVRVDSRGSRATSVSKRARDPRAEGGAHRKAAAAPSVKPPLGLSKADRTASSA